MRSLITKAKNFLGSYQQPLTKRPSKQFSPVSDLFIWRKGQNWSTFFELTNIASLFYNPYSEFRTRSANTSVRILIFDSMGNVVNEKIMNAPIYSRFQVNISDLAHSSLDQVGTFCILHSSTPTVISKHGSMLAERGYVSYSFCGTPLRSYVHGNLDAISSYTVSEIERLGGTSFLQREFRLQHDFLSTSSYEIAIVNPSTSKQNILCEVIESNPELSKKNQLKPFLYREIVTDEQQIMLPSGGCHIFNITPGDTTKRLKIRSHLVMARPLVFRMFNNSLDVFHG